METSLTHKDIEVLTTAESNGLDERATISSGSLDVRKQQILTIPLEMEHKVVEHTILMETMETSLTHEDIEVLTTAEDLTVAIKHVPPNIMKNSLLEEVIDDYEHYCTLYETQKLHFLNLLLSLWTNSDGRPHLNGLILETLKSRRKHDCKGNQEQLAMTGYDSSYNTTGICCMEMIFDKNKNWNKLRKYIKQQMETNWKEIFISKEKDIYNIFNKHEYEISSG